MLVKSHMQKLLYILMWKHLVTGDKFATTNPMLATECDTVFLIARWLDNRNVYNLLATSVQ